MEIGLTPVICIAQDYINGKDIENNRLRKAILELPDNRTEHLPGYLPIVLGTPVLLTENVATELGLSNGTREIFRQLVHEESLVDIHVHDTSFPANTKFIAHPKYASVEFPNCKLDSELQPKVIPIDVSEQTFMFDAKELLPQNVAKAARVNKKKRTTKISIKRKALPFVSAYSMTTHKIKVKHLAKLSLI